jgi:polyphosphate kinase 2 (PPK2 family)
MLENVNLSRKLDRDEYQKALPALQRRLYDLEKACWDNRVSSIIVFEGWDAAGKGGSIATLTQRLDPRGFKLYAVQPPRTYEQNYPWLWRYWLKAPNRGEMVIFDHSWYRRLLDDRVEKLVPEKTWRQAFPDIVEFERMLADDGTAILKFWFHISKKEQRKRFKKLEADPLESWRVTAEDWARHEKYDDCLEAAEEMLERTDSEYAPWVIVEATSRWYARRKVFQAIIATLEQRLGACAPQAEPPVADKDADLRAAMSTMDAAAEGVA